jgi:hypothetical protein
MAFVIAAILTTLVLGIPVALAIDRRCRGLAYLYGSGLIWAVLFALSLLRVAWSAVVVTVVALALATLLALIARRTTSHSDSGPTNTAYSLPALAIDLLSAYTFLSYALYATLARVWEWDFWAIWGLKARVFIEASGIDWRFLCSPFNDFSHPDYPLLLPLNYAYTALIGGGWDDRWLGLVSVAYGAALLLIVRRLASREMPALAAAGLTFAATAFALSNSVGLAEGPMIAFGSAAVLLIRRAMVFDDDVALRHGAVLLGLAASTKNEGLALIVAVVASMLIVDRSRWRRVLRLWPAVAIVAPWIVVRTVLHLQTDIARGAVVARVLTHLRDGVWLLQRLVADLPDFWMWVFMLAGIVVVPQAFRVAERFVLAVVTIQLAFIVGAYLASPYALEWHIETSWPRLARQIATPLLYAVAVLLARTFERGQTHVYAEARSDVH